MRLPALLTDHQVRTLAVACALQRAYGPGADPADLRVVRMVGQRWLRRGRHAELAAHEWTAVQRAAAALEATERASLDGQTARRAARTSPPPFISPDAAYAAGLVAAVARR